MDKNEQRQESQQNRREERHKRRQRSQIIAYTVVGIMILVLAAGIAFAVSKITGMSHNRQEQQKIKIISHYSTSVQKKSGKRTKDKMEDQI